MPLWYALLPAIAMSFSGMVRKLMSTRMDYDAFTAYYNIRSILITAIFDKVCTGQGVRISHKDFRCSD